MSRPEISLLIRQHASRPSELAFYLCHTPRPVPLTRLVRVAGTRWAVEECFQAAKNEAALDHYQVRLYKAWYRYITLAMLALAWLAVTRAASPTTTASCRHLSERDPPHVHHPLRTAPRREARPPLVTMAPQPPAACTPVPLPAATRARSLSAAGVLARARSYRNALQAYYLHPGNRLSVGEIDTLLHAAVDASTRELQDIDIARHALEQPQRGEVVLDRVNGVAQVTGALPNPTVSYSPSQL